MPHSYTEISCDTTQLPELPFCGPHAKPHGVRRLYKNYHLRLYPELSHGKCIIQHIPYSCIECAKISNKPWASGVKSVTKLLMNEHTGTS